MDIIYHFALKGTQLQLWITGERSEPSNARMSITSEPIHSQRKNLICNKVFDLRINNVINLYDLHPFHTK
jgi:hypothetical protein